MAIRVRKDGTMWCAAHTEPREGDTYIDDGLHYHLSVEKGVIVALPMPEHEQHPQWWWREAAPAEADFWRTSGGVVDMMVDVAKIGPTPSPQS